MFEPRPVCLNCINYMLYCLLLDHFILLCDCYVCNMKCYIDWDDVIRWFGPGVRQGTEVVAVSQQRLILPTQKDVRWSRRSAQSRRRHQTGYLISASYTVKRLLNCRFRVNTRALWDPCYNTCKCWVFIKCRISNKHCGADSWGLCSHKCLFLNKCRGSEGRVLIKVAVSTDRWPNTSSWMQVDSRSRSISCLR